MKHCNKCSSVLHPWMDTCTYCAKEQEEAKAKSNRGPLAAQLGLSKPAASQVESASASASTVQDTFSKAENTPNRALPDTHTASITTITTDTFTAAAATDKTAAATVKTTATATSASDNGTASKEKQEVALQSETLKTAIGSQDVTLAASEVADASKATGSGEGKETSARKPRVAAEPAKLSTTGLSGPRECGQCGIVGLREYFFVPDTDEFMCGKCFVCSVCGEQIAEEPFSRQPSQTNDKPSEKGERRGFVHQRCLQLHKCVRCLKVINGSYVRHQGKPIHSDCFTCAKCNEHLAGKRYFIIEEKEYCENCEKLVD